MFVDARTLEGGELFEADICIIGGGAAGISIAVELIGSPLKVILLESGDLGFDERTQSLYEGPNLGVDGWALDRSRLRFLGGSTNHWAGNCMRLDPIDFEAREGIPHSGWPISREDLDPYYPRAQALVETPHTDLYDNPERRQRMGLPTLEWDPERLRTFIYAESPPAQFGSSYEDVLAEADNVVVYLNANALEIETNDTASQATGVPVAVIDGPRFRVEAKNYVLAAGGIEIPRLLLLSNKVAPNGLGNEHDLVGRFFMDHLSFRPSLTSMLAEGDEQVQLYTKSHKLDGGYFRGAIAASETLLRKERLPNFCFFVFSADDRSPGQQSAEAMRRALSDGSLPEDLSYHIESILTDLDGVTNEVFRTVTGADQDLISRDWLEPWTACECVPNPESRVMLVEERDEIFGQNKIGLDWRLTDLDLEVHRRATEVLAMELGRLGFGRVWSSLLQDGADWPAVMHHGKHHCGTTRMSADPKTGVVDPNCRVHGVSNLYVSSSSVFPTHGFATPTLTIVALAVRLAEHLRSVTR